MQGILTFLGRSMEFMDAVADSVGGLLGITSFSLAAYFVKKKEK
jgi:VanZ family protein